MSASFIGSLTTQMPWQFEIGWLCSITFGRIRDRVSESLTTGTLSGATANENKIETTMPTNDSNSMKCIIRSYYGHPWPSFDPAFLSQQHVECVGIGQ